MNAMKRLMLLGLLVLLCLLLAIIYHTVSIMPHKSRSASEKYNYNHTDETKKLIKRLNAEHVEQDDPALVNLIKHFFLHQPSILPYDLTDHQLQDYSQGGQSTYLDMLLNQKENGFFVESGALDGERLSNSLYFEKSRNWSGILIEPHPGSYNILRSKNRKAFSINSCLSMSSQPAQMPMVLDMVPDLSGFNDNTSAFRIERKSKIAEVTMVQCFPLYSILLASGRTELDIFSLDIEGAELDVLKTIPWKNVDIKLILVEYEHIKEGKDALVDFMTSKGYTTLPNTKNWQQDIVFAKKGIRI